MKFKITNPFDIERLNSLSSDEKAEYLDLLCSIADKRKIPSSVFETDKDLDCLMRCGMITVEIEKEKYIEFGEHYLNLTDYEKLLVKYDKRDIDDSIERFKGWNSSTKDIRKDIYRTMSTWLKDSYSKKTTLTGEYLKFAEKSWDAYIERTDAKDDNSFKIKYYKILEKYFIVNKYPIEEIRDHLKEMISNNECKGKYTKSMHISVGELMDIQKYKREVV